MAPKSSKKLTTLRAHATTGVLKLPGPEVKRLIEDIVMKGESFLPTKSPHVMHDCTTYARDTRRCDADKCLEMVLELLNNAVDPSEKIFSKYRKDIRVCYDSKHHIVQVLYKDELLLAVQCTDTGFRILNPGKPFPKGAYRLGNGPKQDSTNGGGGYNYGAKQAARTGVEHGFTLAWEFVGHSNHNKRQRCRSGLGADQDKDNEGCMCAWVTCKGGVDTFDLNSSLPLVETLFDIDNAALPGSPQPPEDEDERMDWEDARQRWKTQRVLWAHEMLFKALCAFEFMYDMDMETPSNLSSPLFGGATVYGTRYHGHFLHRNRYTPRVKKLWSHDEVEVPKGLQMVLKLRMYDLTSSRHSACNGYAKHVPNGIMRLPDKGFPTKRTLPNGTSSTVLPVAAAFENEHRIACSYWTKEHFKKILCWELFNGAHPEVIGAQLLPMLRGGSTELLGACAGELFNHLAEGFPYSDNQLKIREAERGTRLREVISYAAVRADSAAREEAAIDIEALNRMLANEPVLYRSDTATEDGPRAQYYASFLATCAIEASVDSANSTLFRPSSLNLDAAEKRVAIKVKALADEDEAKYAPPDELRQACEHMYGPDHRIYYVPSPKDGTRPYDIRNKTVIVIHQRSDNTRAMKSLMQFGRGKRELDLIMDYQAALSTGKCSRWRPTPSDAARALVDGLPKEPDKKDDGGGYESGGSSSSNDKRKWGCVDGGGCNNKPPKDRKTVGPDLPDNEQSTSDHSDSDISDDSVIQPDDMDDSDDSDNSDNSDNSDSCLEPAPLNDPPPKPPIKPIDPTKIKNQHPSVIGGWKPCHTMENDELTTFCNQEPHEVKKGILVLIPIDQPWHKNHPHRLLKAYEIYEDVREKVKAALEKAGEWGGWDGHAKLSASFAPDANWWGLWSREKGVWINIGNYKSAAMMAVTIIHELAHHNTYGKEYDPHGRLHGEEAERLTTIVFAKYNIFK